MLNKISNQVKAATDQLLAISNLNEGDIFILGGSSSEVMGQRIGQASNKEVGQAIVGALVQELEPKGIALAVQACEHLNRALVVEKTLARERDLVIVNAVPSLNAGGSFALAAYESFKDPVMVEYIVADAGMDIGDSFIGMHVRHVQVPVRLDIGQIGQAHLTAVRSRPKLIGGDRAQHF